MELLRKYQLLCKYQVFLKNREEHLVMANFILEKKLDLVKVEHERVHLNLGKPNHELEGSSENLQNLLFNSFILERELSNSLYL